MKLSTATAPTVFLISVGLPTTTAFVTPSVTSTAAGTCTSLSMAGGAGNDRDTAINRGVGGGIQNDGPARRDTLKDDTGASKNFQYKATQKSQAIPFMNASPFLDGSMAGDVGFDPLGFADSVDNLNKYREAELRHGRLAMLAAAGWPLSELFDVKIAKMLDMDPVIFADNGFRAPSVLNGGMGLISPLYWVGCLAAAGIFEAISLSTPAFNEKLYPKSVSDKNQKWIQTAEIKNGRLAMLAITAFAAQEFVTHIAIVEQVPFFFKPITETLLASPSETFPGLYVADPPSQEVMEAVTQAAVDATAVKSDAATIMEAANQATTAAATATADTTAATTAATAEAATAAVDTATAGTATTATTTVMESTSSAIIPPTSVESAVTEDLIAAKKRIAELESQLASIRDLTIQ